MLWFVNINSCASVVLSWLGFLPSQFATTIALFVKSYLIQPVKPSNEDRVLEMWLREFAWSEEEIPSFLEQRGNGCCLKSAPLFCFERSVKTFYWSAFIYDIQQVFLHLLYFLHGQELSVDSRFFFYSEDCYAFVWFD